jgi:hypothetical protein
MGELLSPDDFSYFPNSTLLWEQVDFRRDGGILLHVRSPKVSKKEGEFLDLFPFHDKTCCPVMVLKKLLLMQNNQGCLKLNLLVFRFISGRNLTQKCLKGQSNEIFYLRFFHRWTDPKPLTRYLKTFRI